MKSGSFIITSVFAMLLLASCSSKVLQVENSEKLLKIEKYEETIKIKDTAQPPEPEKAPEIKAIVKKEDKKEEDKKETSEPTKEKEKKPKKVAKEKPKKIKKKLPKLEDAEGFDGRRPIVDPFRPGEKVTLKLSYFNIVAGEMTISVLPFKEVNGKKSYHFQVSGKSNSFFSSIYAVDDMAETYLDYETLLPYNMAIDAKETKQLRTVRSYFDWKKMKAFYWEKKITKEKGVEKKEYDWDIQSYAQNIFSAAFYLRTFTLTPGKVVEFRLADDKKNMVVKGHVLRRETIKTDIGELKTIVIKPEIAIDGIFKPMGEVYFWLTDDDRKFIVRIESAIRIGKIVGSLKEIIP